MKKNIFIFIPLLILSGCSNMSISQYKDIYIYKINHQDSSIKIAGKYDKKTFENKQNFALSQIENTSSVNEIVDIYNDFNNNVNTMFLDSKTNKTFIDIMFVNSVDNKLASIEYEMQVNDQLRYCYYYGKYDNFDLVGSFITYHLNPTINTLSIYDYAFEYYDSFIFYAIDTNNKTVKALTSVDAIENTFNKEDIKKINDLHKTIKLY